MRFKVYWVQGWQVDPAGTFKGGEVVDAAGFDAVVAERAALTADLATATLYHASYFKQADDTLALILRMNGREHEQHDECGVICKINDAEGLIERLTTLLAEVEGELEMCYQSICECCRDDERFTPAYRPSARSADGVYWWHDRAASQAAQQACAASTLRERRWQRERRRGEK